MGQALAAVRGEVLQVVQTLFWSSDGTEEVGIGGSEKGGYSGGAGIIPG